MNEIEQYIANFDKQIADRLYHTRVMLGYSRKELAAQIGITGQQLAKYEAGKNRASAPRLVLISSALGRTVDYFLQPPTDSEELLSIYNGAPKLSSNHLSLMKKFLKITNKKHQKALIMLVDSMADLNVQRGDSYEI